MPILITANTRMELANMAADAAACLDCIRSNKSSVQSMIEALKEAPMHVVNLHNMALYFAGARAHEIYSPEDSADVLTPEAQANFLKKFEVTA